MTLKEFFESNQLLAINLKTKEQSIIFSKEADKLGKKWSSGANYVDYNFWDEYEGKTCYTNRGCFSFISHYENSDENLQCKILNFEDVEWGKEKMNNFTKKDIKNGAIVELRNGKRFLKVDNSLFGLKNDELYANSTSYMLLDYYDENLRYKPDVEYDIMKILNSTTIFSIDGCGRVSALLPLNYVNFSWTWEREETRKIKLKDLTPEQYKKWCKDNCSDTKCTSCIFYKVSCDERMDDCWIKNKDLYNEKFLNQELEIEEE